MNTTFDNYFQGIINESILDIPRNSLDPTVFEFPDDGPPILNPMIKTQIMNDVSKLKQINGVQVVVYFIVGSILTKRYSPKSDIDVNVQIDTHDNFFIEEVMDVVKELNGKLAAGTTHPINYYIVKDDYDLDKTDAAYDVSNETWIKEPDKFDMNVGNYMQRFENSVNGIDFRTAELRRDIIDLEELKEMDADQIKDLESRTQEKIDEIEDNIEALVRSYKNVKTLRHQAYEKDMTPSELRKYGRKNKLPENVIYKMMERYYYFDFIKELKKILSDDKVTDQELDKIKGLGKDLWK